mmetsp:Transcript_37315/g.64124  ORF Transcript_37315/g.64124 Transcript_37315/m.64124 type:complete len:243 (-) Transcript_37315:102-830(-)
MNKLFRGLRGLIKVEEEISLSSQLQSKTFLVVGAQTGAGNEICNCLAEDKHKLALACDSGKDSLNSLSKDLLDKGATVNIFEFNLGNEENIKDVVNGAVSQFDTLDAMILALEEPFRGDLSDLEDPTKVIDSVLDANYYTLVYFTYYALPLLRKSRGKIILLSSFHEPGQDEGDALYYASRGATLGFFETLQEEETGISILIVHGANTHPQEISRSGSHKPSTSKGDQDVQKSAKLVWTASR